MLRIEAGKYSVFAAYNLRSFTWLVRWSMGTGCIIAAMIIWFVAQQLWINCAPQGSFSSSFMPKSSFMERNVSFVFTVFGEHSLLNLDFDYTQVVREFSISPLRWAGCCFPLSPFPSPFLYVLNYVKFMYNSRKSIWNYLTWSAVLYYQLSDIQRCSSKTFFPAAKNAMPFLIRSHIYLLSSFNFQVRHLYLNDSQ